MRGWSIASTGRSFSSSRQRTPLSNMIRPLADAMGQYVPHFAVDHRFETYAFAGCAADAHRGILTRSDPRLAI